MSFKIVRLLNTYLVCRTQSMCFSKTQILCGNGENVRDTLFNIVSEDSKPRRKISILGGSSKVGATAAFGMILKNVCDEIVLVDTAEKSDRIYSEALDLSHAKCLFPSPKVTVEYDPSMCRSSNSDIIIVTAGERKKPNDDIMKIAQTNIITMKKYIPILAALSPQAIFIVVTTPVDVISYAVWKYSGFDKNRVFGTGTINDTLRLKYHMGKQLGINPSDVDASVIAQHGEYGFPVWSTASVGGTTLRHLNPCLGINDVWNVMFREVVETENVLNKFRGFSCYTMGVILTKLCDDILKDKNTIHHLSILVNGIYNITHCIFMSLPVVVGNRGVRKVVRQYFDEAECKLLQCSVETLADQIKCLKF